MIDLYAYLLCFLAGLYVGYVWQREIQRQQERETRGLGRAFEERPKR